MILLVDMGNSRLKWRMGNQDQIEYLPYEVNDFPESLRSKWQKLSQPDLVGLACVATALQQKTVENIIQSLWPSAVVYLYHTKQHYLGLKTVYENPESLGVDRWLAMLGAIQCYSGPLLLVDCGSAIKIDLVDAECRHQGGLILPGLQAMKMGLDQITQGKFASLQLASQPQAQLGRNTVDCISSGLQFTALATVEKLIMDYRIASEQAYQVIIAGGDAGFFFPELESSSWLIDQHLVFSGMQAELSHEGLIS